MKNMYILNNLEQNITDILSPVIQVPFKITCKYHAKSLSVVLTNTTKEKSYLISTLIGKRNIDGFASIDLFYVMPHFQGYGIGKCILESYSELLRLEGEPCIQLKPVPFLPESRNPFEYFRLYFWLGPTEQKKVTRNDLIQFYKDSGFEPIYPNDIGSEMQRSIHSEVTNTLY